MILCRLTIENFVEIIIKNPNVNAVMLFHWDFFMIIYRNHSLNLPGQSMVLQVL